MTATTLCVCELHEPFDENLAQDAWKMCQKKHPNLTCHIRDGCISRAHSASQIQFFKADDIDQAFT